MSTVLSSPRSSSTLVSQTRDSSKLTTPTPPTSGSSQGTHTPSHPDRYASTTEKSVHWNDPSNNFNPFNWPDAKKWRVTLLACFMTFIIQLNGTMMTSAAEQINERFYISDEHFPHSYWPVLSWSLGGAAAPLLGLPLMENFGVRWSYVVR